MYSPVPRVTRTFLETWGRLTYYEDLVQLLDMTVTPDRWGKINSVELTCLAVSLETLRQRRNSEINPSRAVPGG